MEKIIYYGLCAIIFVALWMGVVGLYAYNNWQLAYWPFIVLLVFVYPAIAKLLKQPIHKKFGKKDEKE